MKIFSIAALAAAVMADGHASSEGPVIEQWRYEGWLEGAQMQLTSDEVRAYQNAQRKKMAGFAMNSEEVAVT